MAAKKQQAKRGQSDAARKNQEVDDLDLASQFRLPPAADAALSPLAAQPATRSPAEADQSDRSVNPSLPADDTTAETPVRAAELTDPEQPTAEPSAAGRRRSNSTRGRPKASDAEVEQARKTRDEERERLVREALEKLGRDPDELAPKPLPKGGKHRPTIELSPDEYAAINIANAIRPDLFDTTLVGFVRACAKNWERIAAALEEEQTGSRVTASGIEAPPS